MEISGIKTRYPRSAQKKEKKKNAEEAVTGQRGREVGKF